MLRQRALRRWAQIEESIREDNRIETRRLLALWIRGRLEAAGRTSEVTPAVIKQAVRNMTTPTGQDLITWLRARLPGQWLHDLYEHVAKAVKLPDACTPTTTEAARSAPLGKYFPKARRLPRNGEGRLGPDPDRFKPDRVPTWTTPSTVPGVQVLESSE